MAGNLAKANADDLPSSMHTSTAENGTPNIYSKMKIQGSKANEIVNCMANKGILPVSDPSHPYEKSSITLTPLPDEHVEEALIVTTERNGQIVQAGFGKNVAWTPDATVQGKEAEPIRSQAKKCIYTSLAPRPD